jgi:hypothetical protein
MALNLIDVRQINSGQLDAFIKYSVTGVEGYKYNLNSGVGSFNLSFSEPLNAIPYVSIQINSSGIGDAIISPVIRSVTTSGCSGELSNFIPSSGYYAIMSVVR